MRDNKPTIITNNLSMKKWLSHVSSQSMYKSKETFYSIKFKQRFYFTRFPPSEKITVKVVFHTKRYNLKTTLRSSAITIKY